MINRVRWASVAASLDMRSGIATLADAATAELRERILSGELESGAPLRLEELARSLGTSISPVREAVRKLEALGLAVHVAHRGSRVKELDVDDLRDTYEARLALEPRGRRARVGAHRRRPTSSARRRRSRATRRCRERGDRPAARDAHDAFHFTLYNASGSRLARAPDPPDLGQQRALPRALDPEPRHRARAPVASTSASSPPAPRATARRPRRSCGATSRVTANLVAEQLGSPADLRYLR